MTPTKRPRTLASLTLERGFVCLDLASLTPTRVAIQRDGRRTEWRLESGQGMGALYVREAGENGEGGAT